MHKTRPRPVCFYAGLLMLCMTVLMLQITETRLLSVVAYYYLAFLTISMAMFGMTVGALLVYFNPAYADPNFLSYRLGQVTSAFAVTMAVCGALQLASVATIVPSATTVVIWLKLLLLLAAPFVFAGIAVSLALTRTPFPIGVVYGVDLVGAASGCLIVLVLLNTVDAPSGIFIIASLAAAGAFLFANSGLGEAPSTRSRRAKLLSRPGSISAALFLLGIANASTSYGLRPVSIKNDIESSHYALEKWNSLSRIVASHSRTGPPPLWSASRTLDPNLRVESRGLNIDGFAGSAMPRFDGDLRSVSYLAFDVTNLAYCVRNIGRAAVVGVGSGRDLLSAYLFGFRDVTGVELNPIFINFLESPSCLRSYAGIAELRGVRLVVDEGRSWFARTQDRFDVIQMSMIDTFASTGAGAFSLSENGLYTVEAWKIFLSALRPDGVFTVSRWHSPQSPVESGRVVSLAMAALFSLHVQDPKSHVFMVSNGNLATIIVGRQPLSQNDLSRLTDAVNRYQYDLLLSPSSPAESPVFASLAGASNLSDLNRRAERYPLDMTAPTDSRPFFFNQLRISHPEDVMDMIAQWRRSGAAHVGASLVITGNLLASGTLAMVILLSAMLVTLVIILPARSSIRIASRKIVWPGTAYFVLIGLGFMLVEIALVQRISVFIGHPTYGLSVVLFSIILSAGIGSFLSERFGPRSARHFLLWLGGLGGYVLLLPLWLPAAGHSVEPASLLVRSLVSVGAILPAGVAMGFGFPTGMRLVNRLDPQLSPWFWGINGAASVLAGGLAVACSIAFSISITLALGGFCYWLLFPVVGLLSTQVPLQRDLALDERK